MLYKRCEQKSPDAGLPLPPVSNAALGRLFAVLFLLVSVLSKALLTLVRSHLVFLSFFSARHMNVLICRRSTGMFIVYFKSSR